MKLWEGMTDITFESMKVNPVPKITYQGMEHCGSQNTAEIEIQEVAVGLTYK